jgi:hypothetical protein
VSVATTVVTAPAAPLPRVPRPTVVAATPGTIVGNAQAVAQPSTLAADLEAVKQQSCREFGERLQSASRPIAEQVGALRSRQSAELLVSLLNPVPFDELDSLLSRLAAFEISPYLVRVTAYLEWPGGQLLVQGPPGFDLRHEFESVLGAYATRQDAPFLAGTASETADRLDSVAVVPGFRLSLAASTIIDLEARLMQAVGEGVTEVATHPALNPLIAGEGELTATVVSHLRTEWEGR